MFEKEAEEYSNGKGHEHYNYLFEEHAGSPVDFAKWCFKDGVEFGYNKANEQHSPDEHIDKDRIVLGIIKHCNKTRYSLVQWNGEWWYQYGTYNTEVRLITWYNIPELKESE